MYFVVEWITMSAPHSIGRQRYGVAKVLSIIRGTPLSCAIFANFSISKTVSAGFASVSPKTAFVLGLNAALISSSLASATTKMHSIPSFLRVKAKRFIEENYADQNTTLTSVAEAVCLSPNHFSTIFSQECKTTFIEYLTNVRLENAKRLMRETDMKGYDIAYECGFSDPHYFSYIFKKNTGLSPREYKLSTER